MGEFGGASAIVLLAASTIWWTGSDIACRISSSVTRISVGAPVASARPVTIAARPCGAGNAEPIAILISSADFSPIATSYSRRRWFWIAVSRSKPPSRVEPPKTTPPMEATAISVVPPPMSTIRFPIGSWIRRRADRGGERLLDEHDVAPAGELHGLPDGPAFDLGGLARHA